MFNGYTDSNGSQQFQRISNWHCKIYIFKKKNFASKMLTFKMLQILD